MNEQRLSLLLALAGFSLFSLGDGVTKSTAGLWPGTAVAALRFSIGAVGLAIAVLLINGRSGFMVSRPWIQLARGAAMAFSTACFFVGIQFIPLAVAAAVGFTTPMLTALFSAIFLREKVPPVVWGVSALAFAGVLLVLQPSFAGIGLKALLPLGGAVGMSLLMIFNRMAGDSASPLQMQMLVAAIAAPLLIAIAWAAHLTGLPAFHVDMPGWPAIGRAALIACTATVAHWMIYLATTRASAALVAPTIYVQMLFAVVIGWSFFGDMPRASTFIGSTLIIGAGLWLFRSRAIRP